MILLDSHTWLWWTNRSWHLPSHFLTALESSSDDIGVSSISVWELSLAVRKGRLQLSVGFADWMTQSTRDLGITIIPLDDQMAIGANGLPGSFHADPADRFIVSTAIHLKAKLATFDAKILSYPHVQIYQP